MQEKLKLRCWISGIAGFLGSHLAEALLAEGHIIDGNDNLICGDSRNTKLGFWRTDCCNRNILEQQMRMFKPETVIHCAATAHEGLSSFSPSFITRNIYEASVSTFSAAISAGASRIIYMSSMARYGRQQPPFSEDMQPQPVDPYGVAKVAAEDTLKILCQTHDVKWSIAVPHNIIGIKQRSVDPFRNVAAIMINRCKQGKPPIVYGDGLQKRCFSPVKDCIPTLLRMVNGDADGHIVNIGPDKGEITILDLATKVAELTNYNGAFQFMPDRPNEVKEAYTSSDKARELLGYEPRQSIDDCLKEMVDYIKPEPFVYDFPLEIMSDKMPRTWSMRLM